VRTSIVIILLAALPVLCQEGQPAELPKLKQRNDAQGDTRSPEQRIADSGILWVVPAGTKIPIQLRQAVSTKNAQPGDPIYAQTTFPVVVNSVIMIPAGTFVQGVVDNSKRAGRIKGRAELQFHLTKLIYASGYTLELAAAVDQVPGSPDSQMKEPGTVARDAEKGSDLKKIGEAAATGGQIGAIGGAASGSVRGLGVGGLSGIAAGTLISLLARGSDVRFEIGSGVEVSLNHAIGIEPEKVMLSGMPPASSAPAPVIPPPAVAVQR
jgi:hypothetical protein